MADDEAAHRAGFVAIVGRPSVGKSTLLNALVGRRISITSRKPQTTRHRITGIMTRRAAQIAFVDTPGFQTRHRSRLNERLNRSVRDALEGVGATVWVIEAMRITKEDHEVLALLPRDVPIIVALNKIDAIADKSALLPRIAEIAALRDFAAIVPVSAEKSVDLDVLTREIVRTLPEGPPLYPESEITDRDERFLAAEFVREKVFRLLGDEVPYGAAVAIEGFEHEGGLRRIGATIFVEKASQRAIMIGEGGERMKAIASQARADMERLFGGKVFLDVWVRVRRGWSSDEAMLTRLGY